jgi:hypothetical protein
MPHVASRWQANVNNADGKQSVMHDLNLHGEANDLRQFMVKQKWDVLLGYFKAGKINNDWDRVLGNRHFSAGVGDHGNARELVKWDGFKHGMLLK